MSAGASRGAARPWRRILALAWVLWLVACQGNPLQRLPIIVASADSPEQVVLGQMTIQLLRAAGYTVVDKTNLGQPWMVRAALVAGQVDIWWEYTGETWLVYLRHDRPLGSAEETFSRVRQEDAYNQITWVAQAPCQHRYGIVMLRSKAQELGIASLSELAIHLNRRDKDLRLCTPQEAYATLGGIQGLEQVYKMRFNPERVRFFSLEEGYRGLVAGQCDCALGLSTDLEVIKPAYIFLRDDRGFFQASNLAVAVRTPVLREFPALENPLSRLAAALTQESLGEIQRQLSEGAKPGTVAKRFLSKSGLLRQIKAER